MPEWSIGHAWKACVQQCTEGSNPSLSATFVEWLKKATVCLVAHELPLGGCLMGLPNLDLFADSNAQGAAPATQPPLGPNSELNRE
jgi:hypothetical protein